MDKDLFWELFLDTGDPLCWLLSRREEQRHETEKAAAGDGENKPSPP